MGSANRPQVVLTGRFHWNPPSLGDQTNKLQFIKQIAAHYNPVCAYSFKYGKRITFYK
jgi:hypothetical protein